MDTPGHCHLTHKTEARARTTCKRRHCTWVPWQASAVSCSDARLRFLACLPSDARAGSSCFQAMLLRLAGPQFYRRAYRIRRRRRLPLLGRPAHPPEAESSRQHAATCLRGPAGERAKRVLGTGSSTATWVRTSSMRRFQRSDSFTQAGVASYLLGEGRVVESGPRPAFTRHTLQPLRDMRHLEQPSFALPCLRQHRQQQPRPALASSGGVAAPAHGVSTLLLQACG